MAEKLNDNETVSFEELPMANVIQLDALSQLLIETGLITEQEFFSKLKELQHEWESKAKSAKSWSVKTIFNLTINRVDKYYGFWVVEKVNRNFRGGHYGNVKRLVTHRDFFNCIDKLDLFLICEYS